MIKGQITLIRNKRKGGEGYRDVSGVCERGTVKCQELSGTDGRGRGKGDSFSGKQTFHFLVSFSFLSFPTLFLSIILILELLL